MLTSSQVVNGYAQTQPLARKTRWDFDEEHPLRDARGFDLSREVADSSQLTDEETGLANVILTNGARLYVDHAHPEYSAPECTNPRDVVVWDKAGELVIMEGARQARQIPGAPPLNLYKNNTDNKGASYGSHENYLMRRSTPFASIVRHLTPFFVSRQVVTGAGRVGIGQDGSTQRLPDQPAGRLLRGRGRPGDDAQAADHQHPRRAAREPGPVPPAARDHRRREPVRDLDVPEGRDDVAGAGDDRGRLADRRPVRRPAGDRAARDQPRPDLHAPDDAQGRPQADRRPAPGGVPGAGPQVRRGQVRRRRGPADQGRAAPLGAAFSTSSPSTR